MTQYGAVNMAAQSDPCENRPEPEWPPDEWVSTPLESSCSPRRPAEYSTLVLAVTAAAVIAFGPTVICVPIVHSTRQLPLAGVKIAFLAVAIASIGVVLIFGRARLLGKSRVVFFHSRS